MTTPTDYLGDGVYVRHDGFQFWLIANDPASFERVALEPSVFRAFLRYVERVEGVKITVEPLAQAGGAG